MAAGGPELFAVARRCIWKAATFFYYTLKVIATLFRAAGRNMQRLLRTEKPESRKSLSEIETKTVKKERRCHMPWTKDNYPDSMKNLRAEIRYKAIEIANALVEDEHMSEGRAISIATAQAEKWGEERGKKVKKDSA